LLAIRAVGRAVGPAVGVNAESWQDALSLLEDIAADASDASSRRLVVGTTEDTHWTALALTGVVSVDALGAN
jgi:hypothetical protein